MEDDILEKIYSASLKFLEPLDSGTAYKVMGEEAIKLVGADDASILLMRNGGFERVYSSDPIWATIQTRKRGFSYRVYKSGKPRILTDKELAEVHPEVKKARVKSSMIIPLTNQGKSIGVLNVQSREYKQFTKRELNILKLVGSFASLAIRKAQLYEDIRQALDTRDLFISMASHEFKTPITSISGYTQLLRTKIPRDDSPISRWLDGLAAETLRLTILVNELLEVNRIKSGSFQYHLKECSLREITKRAVDNFQFTNPNRQIILSDKLDGMRDIVIGDFNKLLQVLGNILDNAAKFSPNNSQVDINIRAKDNDFIISVSDQGIGIKRSEIQSIFNSYTRGSNAQREGMGLGLYLVKEIIERHQGDLKVKSRLNKGTIFEVRLPNPGV